MRRRCFGKYLSISLLPVACAVADVSTTPELPTDSRYEPVHRQFAAKQASTGHQSEVALQLKPRFSTSMSDPNIKEAVALMEAYAQRTGLTNMRHPRRYLWTDAFAVCNFLGLARATKDQRFLELARRLVDQTHHTLGRHRDDDPRRGWISGSDERSGQDHPTRGGLRIGKEMPERRQDEPFDERLEWERDGQYFHYLSKWMHALDQLSRTTREPRFNLWARELAAAAAQSFIHRSPVGGAPRMYWKISIDLSRPLVPGRVGRRAVWRAQAVSLVWFSGRR